MNSVLPDHILSAYMQGLFPMAEGKHGGVGFYFFEPRGIIPLDERFTIRKSLRQALSKNAFKITFNTAFEEVIRACARHENENDDEVWLSEEMIPSYLELHRRGIAHSVEAWGVEQALQPVGEKCRQAGEPVLLGGLYGLSLGKAFCGESMFSRIPYASQAALVTLVEHLRERGFTLLDAQMATEHLEQFGLYSVSQEEYLALFHEAQKESVGF